MWNCTGQNITMVRGDFGIELPITIGGATFAENDELRLKICRNGEEIVSKVFDTIEQNTITLMLTEEESDLLRVGAYAYSLDWYHDDAFMCNVIPTASFKVVGKE